MFFFFALNSTEIQIVFLKVKKVIKIMFTFNNPNKKYGVRLCYLQSGFKTVNFKGYRFSLEVVKIYFKQMQILFFLFYNITCCFFRIYSCFFTFQQSLLSTHVSFTIVKFIGTLTSLCNMHSHFSLLIAVAFLWLQFKKLRLRAVRRSKEVGRLSQLL